MEKITYDEPTAISELYLLRRFGRRNSIQQSQ